MKLLTLNLWGGIVHEPLLEFIKKHSSDVDVFCFQEVLFGETPSFTEVHKARVNIFNEISEILTDFNAHKRITQSNNFQREPINFSVGQATFVRKNISIEDGGDFYCYDHIPHNTNKGGKITGSLEWVEIKSEGENFLIANLHGLWQAGTSGNDTPERFVQSEKIKNFLDKKVGKKILCGDFNLNPEGKSIAILEEGMRNLVKELGSPSTRSHFYDGENTCSDYILVSPEIKVKDFEILQDPVSDHLPLRIEF
ncbi:endonuclease/exonuclease/phosphatase family protein [Candidatus Nomurabacteria bacterium]|nr:endonuclease/exonuclease/phosphatase family protein [Candidatus Nomurabacteria bacterium]